MQEPQVLKLDFGASTALMDINVLLQELPIQSGFYQGLLFCKDWLEGEDSFEFKTSGSTGEPKLLKVYRNQLVDSVNRTSRFFKLETGQSLFICLNTQYTGGKMMLARALHNKMRVVWVEARQDAFQHFPNDTHFSLVSMVPSQMHTLMQRTDRELILKNIETILLGGAPVQKDLKEELRAIEAPSVYETFGMTETLSHIAVKKLNGKEAEESFSLLDGVEMRLDERGCIMVKAEVTNDQWVASNDLIEIVDTRHFAWKGRADNVVNSGGVKILLEELEEIMRPLLRAQGVKGDFMLGAKHDPLLGEKLILYVEEHLSNPTEILAAVKEDLPVFHSPKEVIQMKYLPRTSSGKLKRIPPC